MLLEQVREGFVGEFLKATAASAGVPFAILVRGIAPSALSQSSHPDVRLRSPNDAGGAIGVADTNFKFGGRAYNAWQLKECSGR